MVNQSDSDYWVTSLVGVDNGYLAKGTGGDEIIKIWDYGI